jgi:hypothetical protein
MHPQHHMDKLPAQNIRVSTREEFNVVYTQQYHINQEHDQQPYTMMYPYVNC